MKDWFLSLQPRERLTLGAGAALGLVLLVYLLFWEPLDSSVSNLRSTVEGQEGALAWMYDASAQVKTLRAQGGGGPARSGGSLLTVVDQSARVGGIKSALQRMEPDGSNSVKLWIGATSFDNLMTWLGLLEREYAIYVGSITLEPGEGPGIVQARITLERSES